jgi:Fe-S cluster assembly protein SufD
VSAEASDRLLSLWQEGEATERAPALRALRRAGRDAFQAQGLPHHRMEDWRYTPLAPLTALSFARAEPRPERLDRALLEEHAAPVFACGLAVFVDGHLAPQLSGIGSSGIQVEALAGLGDGEWAELAGRLGSLVDLKAHPFAALATAFLEDGALIRIPAGLQLEQPLHVVFVSTPGAERAALTTPRVFIDAGAGSRATIVQDHVTLSADGVHFADVVSEVFVADGASLDLVVLQRASDAAFHVSNLAARLGRDARFASHVITLGGRFVRNELSATLAGEGADATLNGLFLGTGDRLVDNHTWVDHAVPHGSSRELYKGVLRDRSRGVFRGRILVRPGAQKTNAQQSNPNLLLSDGAEIDTKPQLEIYADDVRCSHGSAIGRMDPDALFYLRARGIDEADARVLLTEGFAAEVLRALPDPALADALQPLFAERLAAGGER